MPADFKSPIPLAQLVIEREGLTFTVGGGGDLGWTDVRAIERQHEAQAECTGRPVSWPLSKAHVEALLLVMQTFPGARVARPR